MVRQTSDSALADGGGTATRQAAARAGGLGGAPHLVVRVLGAVPVVADDGVVLAVESVDSEAAAGAEGEDVAGEVAVLVGRGRVDGQADVGVGARRGGKGAERRGRAEQQGGR